MTNVMQRTSPQYPCEYPRKGAIDDPTCGGSKITRMPVLLLDPRCPNQIPIEALAFITGTTSTVAYTDEVPIRVRWAIADLGATTVCDVSDAQLLVTTDDSSAFFAEATAADSHVIVCPSRAITAASSIQQTPIEQAQETISRALDIGEWEQKQTHASLIPYLEEETQEFAQAVRAAETRRSYFDDSDMCDELGDILLQVLFHAEIARRREAFTFNDVAESFNNKMRARAPYLFDGTTEIVPEAEQQRLWNKAKSV